MSWLFGSNNKLASLFITEIDRVKIYWVATNAVLHCTYTYTHICMYILYAYELRCLVNS